MRTSGIQWGPEDREVIRGLMRTPTWGRVVALAGMNRPPLDDASYKEAKGWENFLKFLVELHDLELEEEQLFGEEFDQPDLSRTSATKKFGKAA